MELLISRFSFPRMAESTGIMLDDSARLQLVIKARGFFLFSLAVFGLTSLAALNICEGANYALSRINLPLLALCYFLACCYGLGFHLFRNRPLFTACSKYLQPIFDLFAAAVTLYLTDGLHNWLWVCLLFITLEVAFIFKSIKSVVYICLGESLIYGLILWYGYKLYPYLSQFSFYYIQWFWVVVSNVVTGVIAAKSFITLGEREVSLKHLATKDALTGLYNQGFFLDAIKNELQRSLRYDHSFAVLMIDLDNFKKFNDTYGHQEGNRLLKRVGEILNSSIRRRGEHPTYDIDIACRFGGEEFVIILPEVQHVNEALTVAERIRTRIDQLDLDGKRTSASIGLSMFPMDGKSAAEIVNSADKALYEAKRRGKNCVVTAQVDHLRSSLHVVKKISTSL